MDTFNINILPEENSVNITQGEPVNISVSQEVVQIAKIDESVNLEFLGDVTKIDANYPEALAAAQTAIEKAAEIEQTVEQGTADFNANAVAKTLSFDVHAADSINEAKSWAIGEPVEPAEGSAKYWAGQVGGLISRVDTIEGKIPSAASSSNQLADKDWVESQEYITGITSSDVTTALGYTPYNSSNPAGYTSNIGTVTSVNNTSPDSSGNVTLIIPDALPSQTGQAGKFLTTNGTNVEWAEVDALPSQTGHSGDLLTTNGTDASWVDTETIYPVVETYVNGTEWYRIYSDGWVEQGGMSYIATSSLTTIQFLKSFSSTPNVFVNSQYVGSASPKYTFLNAVNITNSNFQVQVDAQGMNWFACGYGA